MGRWSICSRLCCFGLVSRRGLTSQRQLVFSHADVGPPSGLQCSTRSCTVSGNPLRSCPAAALLTRPSSPLCSLRLEACCNLLYHYPITIERERHSVSRPVASLRIATEGNRHGGTCYTDPRPTRQETITTHSPQMMSSLDGKSRATINGGFDAWMRGGILGETRFTQRWQSGERGLMLERWQYVRRRRRLDRGGGLGGGSRGGSGDGAELLLAVVLRRRDGVSQQVTRAFCRLENGLTLMAAVMASSASTANRRMVSASTSDSAWRLRATHWSSAA